MTPLPRLRPVMLAGTGSDVGKSIIAAGLCRIFRADGYSPAPFKAQNMALNSYATPEGLEIGRAQAVQAEAAGIDCCADMNPLLLKPSGGHTCQVILNGRPAGHRDAYTYFRSEGRGELRAAVNAAFHRLAARYNPIVIEGAGSITELNLADTDLVNMAMAAEADAAVLLVADIDRGGVFASAYGSVMLQSPEGRRRIKGIIVNKFRGDMRLFDSGRTMLERICGVPVLGVVPMMPDVHIDEEDSVALSSKSRQPGSGAGTKVAVVLLPHISNFTDFNVLERTPGVSLFYTSRPSDLAGADAIIIPGSKSTMADLLELRRSGMAAAILEAAAQGRPVLGICGGYQMMGRMIHDPEATESSLGSLPGLGLLPVSHRMEPGKVTEQVRYRLAGADADTALLDGYEIHCGHAIAEPDTDPLTVKADGTPDGAVAGNCMGTYIHGFLDSPQSIARFLGRVTPAGIAADPAEYRRSQYDLLAERLREHLDINRIYDILSH